MAQAKRTKLVWIIAALFILAAVVAWKLLADDDEDALLVHGNGRVEATEIDVASKAAGRVDEIFANEGDFVRADQVLARMDMRALEAQLDQARAQLANARSTRQTAVAQRAAREADVAMAEAVLVQRQTELDIARKTSARTQALRADRAISEQVVDDNVARVRNAEANIKVARAQIAAAEAGVKAAAAQIEQTEAAIKAAEAVVTRLESELADGELKAPRNGRVQYRVVQPGEVIGSGGKVLSLVDISDVYMTFFLPERAAGRVALGSEARIILDALTQYVIPARISYVSSVAQFTPKAVETESERQKMVFRVKARIDPELLAQYPEQVKTGLPGVAHVRLDESRPWPPALQTRLP